MHRILLWLIPVVLLLSCSSRDNEVNSIDSTSNNTCKEPSVKKIYSMRTCNGDECGYFHYLMLNEYLDACFNEYGFVSVADNYLDTVISELPVQGILFIKPFNFEPVYDSQDLGPLDENSISQIFFSYSTERQKIREINSISIWVDGYPKTLYNMNLTGRERRIKNHREMKLNAERP